MSKRGKSAPHADRSGPFSPGERAPPSSAPVSLRARALSLVMLVEYDASLPEWLESEQVAVALSHIAVQLHQAERVVALLGAGVSTAAGIQVRVYTRI